MLSTNTSFLLYDEVNAHINSCKYCYNLDLKCDDFLKCDDLLGILYPYGKYISNNINKNMYFPCRIDLNNWCNKSLVCEPNLGFNNIYKSEKKIACNCSLSNKKSLFI